MKALTRWGFIGTGRIAHRFIADFQKVGDAKLSAVYARSLEKAERFAQEYGAERACGDLEEFLHGGPIDVAYIAVTHPHHLEYAKRCLEAGISVLCEKPLTPNLKQARELVECARAQHTFLMEAFWTRFFPVIRTVMNWLHEGRIGELVAVNASFAFSAPEVPGDRLFEPAEAGGALLDIGAYLVNFLNLITGTSPAKIAACANLRSNGVDQTDGLLFQYASGLIATALCSFSSDGRDTATIYGTRGRIEIREDFWRPQAARLITAEGTVVADFPVDGEGFQYEVRYINDCIAAGLKESPEMPLEASLANMAVCDEIRRQIGVQYPFE